MPDTSLMCQRFTVMVRLNSLATIISACYTQFSFMIYCALETEFALRFKNLKKNV